MDDPPYHSLTLSGCTHSMCVLCFISISKGKHDNKLVCPICRRVSPTLTGVKRKVPVFTFGKYKGTSVYTVFEDDPMYCCWCLDNITDFSSRHPLVFNYLKSLLDKNKT